MAHEVLLLLGGRFGSLYDGEIAARSASLSVRAWDCRAHLMLAARARRRLGGRRSTSVRRRDRLGGLLHEYYVAAA
jgi:hypothetical protein